MSELASKEDLPVSLLEQILMQLKAAGYLESRRRQTWRFTFVRVPLRIFVLGRLSE
jgi:DNA-binding IclR family transcriptional regulator